MTLNLYEIHDTINVNSHTGLCSNPTNSTCVTEKLRSYSEANSVTKSNVLALAEPA